MKRPSIKEVAERAGVGTSTVSRALNNHPNVSRKARGRVERAIQELGYTPNLAAKHFRSGQTNAVSVILPMVGPEFYMRLLSSLSDVLERDQLDTALFPVVGGIRLHRYHDATALPYHADGLVIASLDPTRIYPGTRPPFKKPIVLVDTHHPAYLSVYFDNLAAGRLAAQYALSLRQPIAFVDVADSPGQFESPVFHERREGIVSELECHGVRPKVVLRVPISFENGRRAAQEILEAIHEPVTVLAACDELALGVLRQFSEVGWRAGENYAVLGFDDQSNAEQHGLTTIRQPVEAMGERAAQVLLAALNGDLDTIQQIAFKPELVRRRSA